MYEFRKIIPKSDDPRVVGVSERDAYQHAAERLLRPRLPNSMVTRLKTLAEPFVGVTSDGAIIGDLYELSSDGAPTKAMADAAKRMLELADLDETRTMHRDIDSGYWRFWMNPETYTNQYGVRLEEIRPELRDAILGVLEASMSPAGYKKARDCMRMNHFLGQVINAPKVMNEFSYNFQLFGEPSETRPWGWNLWGHHLCLNCFILDGQMVISPTFMGAEPNVVDEGPWKGLALFREEERLGLTLMQSLPQSQKDRAQIYKLMKDPEMPEGRYHPADQRHLGGAFSDNRVIPYEGIEVSAFSEEQKKVLLQIAEAFLCYLPSGPLRARLAQIEKEFPRTYFAWIGAYDNDAVFYYKIQSPVILIEFDHHSGVFLTNDEPWKCHIHTIVRTPNGNDYGRDLLRQFCQCCNPPRKPGTLQCDPAELVR